MAAPAYKWEYKFDLWGHNRTPVKAVLEAASGEDFEIGTLVYMSSGQVAAAGASASTLIGIALEEIDGATAGDPVEVALIAPGMVIEGTADADASSLAGFNGKTGDLNADGSLDVADTSNGCLSVYRAIGTDSKTVQCVITEFDMGPVN